MATPNAGEYWAFDTHYQRWKRLVYDHTRGDWVFANWAPADYQPSYAPPTQQATAPRTFATQSPYNPSSSERPRTDSFLSHSQTARPAAATAPSRTVPGFPRGEGALVRGLYSPKLGDEVGNLHYEELDHSYYVRDRRYFVEGKVFSVMFSETAGEAATSYNPSISEVRYVGNRVHTSARRFVVVRVRREFCFACPIFTYSNRATTKEGVRPEEHGIVFSHGQEPKLVAGERGIVKPSIAIEMAPGESALHIASRIYYGIHHPVQYNVKLKHIGQVIEKHLPGLIGNWKEEDNGDTKQAADVTAGGDDDDSNNDDDDGSDDLPRIPEDPVREEDHAYSKRHGKMPKKAVQPRLSTPDHYLYHPTNNLYGFDKQLNPQVYHPEYNPYGYHPEHNSLGYHPSSNQYSYHPDQNPYGYHPKYNLHGYHPKHNTIGYHPSNNPYAYHPVHNSIGYHPLKNLYSYHPTHNPHGYHPQKAPFCWHPQFSPYGYHAQKNPSGFHPQVMPRNFHPEVNPLGYHTSHSVHEYHPKHNPYAYHKKHNLSGFHPKHNLHGYHPTHNEHAYHADRNPFGYHPTYYPKSYHPKWQPSGTLYDRTGKVIEDSDDEEDEVEDDGDDDDDDGDQDDDGDNSRDLYEVG